MPYFIGLFIRLDTRSIIIVFRTSNFLGHKRYIPKKKYHTIIDFLCSYSGTILQRCFYTSVNKYEVPSPGPWRPYLVDGLTKDLVTLVVIHLHGSQEAQEELGATVLF